MSLTELIILAAGLSMDAFAVSVCKGLSMPQLNWRRAAAVGCYFGGFQAAMPVIGYYLGYHFKDAIASVDHWIVFILLSIIGISMIKEALSPEDSELLDPGLDFKTMIILALATSIDALAVGITFAFLQVKLLPAAALIGIITFCLSAAGVKAGHMFGARFRGPAEMIGGMILLLMGTKILIEHLFF